MKKRLAQITRDDVAAAHARALGSCRREVDEDCRPACRAGVHAAESEMKGLLARHALSGIKTIVSTSAGCFHKNALVAKIQDDVLPFSACTGVEVECAGASLTVRASCPKGEADLFRRMIRGASRRPMLSGKKSR